MPASLGAPQWPTRRLNLPRCLCAGEQAEDLSDCEKEPSLAVVPVVCPLSDRCPFRGPVACCEKEDPYPESNRRAQSRTVYRVDRACCVDRRVARATTCDVVFVHVRWLRGATGASIPASCSLSPGDFHFS
jgi:hypothetical protein